MPRRVPQPPINPDLREREHRDGWRALVLAAAGLVVILCGARHLTAIETLSGDGAWETQLIKAFSSGGLRHSDPSALPAASVLSDPAQAAAAFERLQRRDRKLDKIKYRVDAGATTPCPT